jgi:2-polyprenyl-6-hydroxyphenyl methylase / 3-demethylubiquinone-9 3-methyltransferase
MPETASAPSVDPVEIARFAAMAEEWWNPDGKFRPLHKFNPIRLQLLRDRICAQFGRDKLQPAPLAGLRLLDIGCGGGLIAEPLARLGAHVTGIDAADRNVRVATIHARQMGLDITYRHAAAEDLAEAGESYDVVLALEIVEHVADLTSFLGACVRLVRPGGLLAVATLNRTPQSYLLAIVGAEYVLRWLPRGTHDWRKFVRPAELAAALRPYGADIKEMTGVAYHPLADEWRQTSDLSVNYLAFSTIGKGMA